MDHEGALTGQRGGGGRETNIHLHLLGEQEMMLRTEAQPGEAWGKESKEVDVPRWVPLEGSWE